MNKNVDINRFAAKVQRLFEKYQDVDKLYATADGQVFFLEDHAIGQGRNLKFANAAADSSVLTINRAEFAELMKRAAVGKALIDALKNVLPDGIGQDAGTADQGQGQDAETAPKAPKTTKSAKPKPETEATGN